MSMRAALRLMRAQLARADAVTPRTATAILGVVNTLAMSVFERTRETGMLRAVGCRPEQTKRMIHLESVLISLSEPCWASARWIGFAAETPLLSALLPPFMVPMLSVPVRRLHGTGKPGWRMLIALIPWPARSPTS